MEPIKALKRWIAVFYPYRHYPVLLGTGERIYTCRYWVRRVVSVIRQHRKWVSYGNPQCCFPTQHETVEHLVKVFKSLADDGYDNFDLTRFS